MSDNVKLDCLSTHIQDTISTAWEFTKHSQILQGETLEDKLGEELQFLLNQDSTLETIMDELACEEYKKHEQQTIFDPPNFKNYVRLSSNKGYVEVFVGNKWITVPADSNINFSSKANYGFRVTISHGGNFTEVAFTPAQEDVEEYIRSGGNIEVSQVEEYCWEQFGKDTYGFAEHVKKNRDFLNQISTAYLDTSKEFQRTFTYKISKAGKRAKIPVKAGKVYHNARKMAKLGKMGKITGIGGIVFDTGMIGYELATDKWDAHTVANGALLVIGVGATLVGAPVVLAGVAVYGILDYAFDISEALDNAVGRQSGLWESGPNSNAFIERTPLFKPKPNLLPEVRTMAIDKTKVATKRTKRLDR
ncbi:hypothetical protein [Flagellimonas marinaquae]|uniref:hypothetical protein n=1 Tax=Flagellimonas marinaquae TaxID=254955 RepID=UPI0020753476|nr:hypothetical protein [Allomuricauda aquimarina]USD26882.1 hypothetical protein MJO53_08285 [Allomuricauda aquimarina]